MKTIGSRSAGRAPQGAWERSAGFAGAVLMAVLFWPQVASAHIVQGEAIGFVSGFLHPISGWDHVVAMIAVGLWGAQLGAPALWTLPIAFPMVMAFGGFLGFAGVRLPADEVMIALSGVGLGSAVVLAWKPPLWVAGAMVACFGLFHGYAHGIELKPGQNALSYSAGFVLATGLLHLAGIVIGLAQRWRFGAVAVRAAGAVVLASGLYFLTSAVSAGT